MINTNLPVNDAIIKIIIVEINNKNNWVLILFLYNALIMQPIAIIAGIMIHISVYELIPGAYKQSTLKGVLKYFLIGFVIMIISHILMG